MKRWYLSDRQIVDRIADECHLRSKQIHSTTPGENERAVRAISWVAWDYATQRRRRRFRWWPF